jgi:hypothetical protein
MLCGCLAVAAPAAAQTTSAAGEPTADQTTSKPVAPKPPGPRHELLIGGVFSGPSSMGSADAQLLGGNGQSSVTLFSTQNGMSAGFGPELALGFRAKRTMWIEVSGSVTWPNLESKITNDFEGAPSQTLSTSVTRWTLEGALVFWVKDQGRTGWFIRAGGGVAGEVSSDLSTSATAALGSGGVGVRHWFHESKGGLKKMGIRAEFRGVVQGGGLSFSDRTIRFAPTGAVHLVFGY